MTGTIVVEGPGGSPLAGGPSRAISIHSRQQGTAVRGSVRLADAATGGRLEIDLRASAKSLGRQGTGAVRVGRLTKSQLKPGTLRFAVALGPAAKRSARLRGPLRVTVEVIVQPPGRRSTSLTRHVLLRH
jgi:hypothetical protein